MSEARFVSCVWDCAKCRRDGTTRLWAFSDEQDDQLAQRWQQSTRGKCVTGCLFTVAPRSKVKAMPTLPADYKIKQAGDEE